MRGLKRVAAAVFWFPAAPFILGALLVWGDVARWAELYSALLLVIYGAEDVARRRRDKRGREQTLALLRGEEVRFERDGVAVTMQAAVSRREPDQ